MFSHRARAQRAPGRLRGQSRSGNGRTLKNGHSQGRSAQGRPGGSHAAARQTRHSIRAFKETLIYSVLRFCFTFFETVEDGRVHSCFKKRPRLAKRNSSLISAPLKCSCTAGKSLPAHISRQGFSGKSLQSSSLRSFVNCSGGWRMTTRLSRTNVHCTDAQATGWVRQASMGDKGTCTGTSASCRFSLGCFSACCRQLRPCCPMPPHAQSG